MTKLELSSGWPLVCDLVPQGVIEGRIANGVSLYGDDKHKQDHGNRDPEAPHVGLGLLVFIHRVEYSA